MASKETDFQLVPFSALSVLDLYQILQLRNAVFVLEQNCPYLDIDDLDQTAWHLYQKTDRVEAYARILPPEPGVTEHSSIGRVAVAQNARQQQLGRRLMLAAIEACQLQFPNHAIKISAQSYLHHFYHSLGFADTGHYYLEDQIPHQEMIYRGGAATN